MDFLVVLTCAVVAIAIYFFQILERESQDGGAKPTSFYWCLAAVVYVLGLTALGFMGNGVIRLQEEFRVYSGVAPLAVSSVLWYSVWLWGWSSGRHEGRSAKREV